MVSPENDKYIEMVGQGERAWGVIIQIEKEEVSVHIIGYKSASALFKGEPLKGKPHCMYTKRGWKRKYDSYHSINCTYEF